MSTDNQTIEPLIIADALYEASLSSFNAPAPVYLEVGSPHNQEVRITDGNRIVVLRFMHDQVIVSAFASVVDKDENVSPTSTKADNYGCGWMLPGKPSEIQVLWEKENETSNNNKT